MRIRFTQSARRRRIGRAQYVMDTVEPTIIPADEADRERRVWVGPDDRGLQLEIVAIVEPDYLLVIHVTPYRYRRRNP